MTNFAKVNVQAKAYLLPFESWERLPGESGAAFSAFCTFRDLTLERNIRRAIETVEKNEAIRAKKFRMWRNWSKQFKWPERAAEFDKFVECEAVGW